MYLILGNVAILSALGCLLLYFMRANTDPIYMTYTLLGGGIFLAAALVLYYFHWRALQNDGPESSDTV